jgi:GNAT superfamily N-acetyltransferase
MHLDTALVRELELASAVTAKHCVVAAKHNHPEYEYLDWCGGIAAFTGVGSPITQLIGAGLGVAVTAKDLDELERFFFDRGADVAIELAPYIHPSFLELLKARPYRLEEFSNVLLRPISAADLQCEHPVGFTVRRATEQDLDLFTRTVAEGFAEEIAVTDDLLDVVRGFASLPNSASYIAFADGIPAGGGSAVFHGKVGGLFGASTLPPFRRRGIQTALMNVRLQWLAEQGCTMAHIITHPGTSSQRNMERAGFRSTYTRTKIVRQRPE